MMDINDIGLELLNLQTYGNQTLATICLIATFIPHDQFQSCVSTTSPTLTLPCPNETDSH